MDEEIKKTEEQIEEELAEKNINEAEQLLKEETTKPKKTKIIIIILILILLIGLITCIVLIIKKSNKNKQKDSNTTQEQISYEYYVDPNRGGMHCYYKGSYKEIKEISNGVEITCHISMELNDEKVNKIELDINEQDNFNIYDVTTFELNKLT